MCPMVVRGRGDATLVIRLYCSLFAPLEGGPSGGLKTTETWLDLRQGSSPAR